MGHWEAVMNTQESGAGIGSTAKEPLFASSWMALYNVIRDQFETGRDRDPESGGAEPLELYEEPAET